MRHLIAGKKLSRDPEHRIALRRNLASALFINGKIKTTEQKAKFVRGFAERMITLAKKGDLASRRRVIALLQDRYIVDAEETDVKRSKSYKIVKAPRLIHKLFSEIAPKYADRPGGYTRIIHLSDRRLGDNGKLVILELIDPKDEKPEKKTKVTSGRRKRAQSRVQFMNSLLKGSNKTEPTQEKPAEEEVVEEASAETPVAEEQQEKSQTDEQTSEEKTEE